MRVVTRIVALAATAVLSVVLVACGGLVTGGGRGDTAQSLSEQAQFNPQAYDNIRDGGTLTTALPEVSPQFNVWQGDASLVSLMLWRWYNPVLITFTADGDAVFNPDYLTEVKPELVDGNTRVT